VNILFLSAEKPHTDIFTRVIGEFKQNANNKVDYKILDTVKLNFALPSIMHPYKKEVQRVGQIITNYQPDLLVVANDQGIHTTFIRICTVRGIPSLTIQDGLLAEKKSKGVLSFLKWRSYLPWRVISSILAIRSISKLFITLGRQWAIPFWGSGGSSKIAVTGEYYKRVLVNSGISPNKIIVTGYPLLDDILKNRSNSNQSGGLFEEIGLPEKRPLILLVTQPLVEDGFWKTDLRSLHFDSVVNAVKHINGQLVVKVHPRERVDVYNRLVDKYNDVQIIVTKEFNLDRLLISSDVVITVCSTVGLWAIAYEKPLLVMNCFPLPIENILASMALSVSELDKLPTVLNHILSDENHKANLISKELHSLHDHMYLLDGHASARIAKLALALANCRNQNSKHSNVFKN